MATRWERRRERIAADPEFAARVRQHSREGQRRRRSGAPPECPFRAKNGNRCWRPLPHEHRTY